MSSSLLLLQASACLVHLSVVIACLFSSFAQTNSLCFLTLGSFMTCLCSAVLLLLR